MILASARTSIADYLSAAIYAYTLLIILHIVIQLLFSAGLRPPYSRATDAILGFLHEAARVARDNCQHAVDMAHKLSLQLRAAEDQIKDLESDVRYYKDRALRAEQWLQRIAEEIKKEFVPRNGERDLPASRGGAGEPASARRP